MSIQVFDVKNVNECLEFNPRTGDVVGVNNYKLAELILDKVRMVTVIETKEILAYYNGYYIQNGRELIQRILVNILHGYRKANGQTVYNTHLAREVTSIIEGLTFKESSVFDQNLDYINCRNGILNFRTYEFIPHTPDYYSRIQINVEYDPNATCPMILKVFEKIIRKEDMRKALEFIAYCLYRQYPIQKVFILLGPGGTGKSHFIDVIRAMLGNENVSSLSMHDLEQDRFATSDLYNKLLNENGDLPQTDLPNVNILKMLTSNKDRIRAQRKGEHAFDFVNFAKIIFASNKLPRVRDDTSGFYRRIEILPFEHVFDDDEKRESMNDLKNIFKPSELSGLLNLVLPYLEPLLERGQFDNSFDVKHMKDQYKKQSDPITSFVETCLREAADIHTTKESIYTEYKKFCKVNHIEPLHQVPFGKILRQVVPWYACGIRDFGGFRHTCLLNTKLIKVSENVE